MSAARQALAHVGTHLSACACACASATLWLLSRPGAPLAAHGAGAWSSAWWALVALVPMMLWLELLAQRRGGPSGAFAALQLGAWAGFGMTLGVALALVPGLERAGYPHADAVQAAALAGAIQCVPIAVATCVSWAAVRRGRRAPGFFVFAWVAAEGLLPLGADRLALSLYDHPSLISLAALGGPALVSLQVALVNAAVAEVLLMISRRPRRPLLLIAAAVALGGSVGIHALRGQALSAAIAQAPTVGVLMVQPGSASAESAQDVQDTEGIEGTDAENGDAAQATSGDAAQLAELTRRALEETEAESAPNLVVWPANALLGLGPSELDLSDRLPRAQRRLDLPFVAGARLARTSAETGEAEPNAAARSAQALVLTDDQRQRSALYQARVRAPFLDVVPLGSWLPAALRDGLHVSSIPAGERGPMMELDAVPFGVMVGWDDVDGGALRAVLADQEPEWLLSLVDDRPFTGTPLAEAHYAAAVFRALEHGRYLLRVAADGGSALIDPLGVTAGRLPHAEGASARIDVPRLRAQTGYRLAGNFPTYLCLFFALSMLLLKPSRAGEGDGDGDQDSAATGAAHE